MKCHHCQSEHIITDIRAVDSCHGEGHKTDLKLEAYHHPEAWIFKETRKGTLKANVCVDCGYVMFFISTEDAEQLERAQQAANNKSGNYQRKP